MTIFGWYLLVVVASVLLWLSFSAVVIALDMRAARRRKALQSPHNGVFLGHVAQGKWWVGRRHSSVGSNVGRLDDASRPQRNQRNQLNRLNQRTKPLVWPGDFQNPCTLHSQLQKAGVELRYIGFDQAQNTRVYEFDCKAEDKSTLRFAVSVDMVLFLRHHVGIQEGPTLCAHKLTADFEAQHRGEHELTNENLLAYVAERTAAEARKENHERLATGGANRRRGSGGRGGCRS